jgi:hypothetical protein
MYLNTGARGAEHALAFDISICNNTFGPINGYAIHFEPLAERRMEYCRSKSLKFEYPSDIRLHNNTFAASSEYALFKNENLAKNALKWHHNISATKNLGMTINEGMEVRKKGKTNQAAFEVYQKGGEFDIPGIPEKVFLQANSYLKAKPLTFEEVGPDWLTEIPGTYAQSGKLTKVVQQRFKGVTSKRK